MKRLKPWKGSSSSAKRARMIKAGQLKVLDREATLAAVRKLVGPDLGDMEMLIDKGLVRAGLFKREVVLWLELEPHEIRIDP